jgi:hypothetical protein
MDTTTVLEIIKMIDANLDNGSNLILQRLPLSENKQHYYMGWKDALTLLQNNLQEQLEKYNEKEMYYLTGWNENKKS